MYDASVIVEKLRKFENSFDVEKMKTHFACKALSNITILKLMKSLGCGLDCVSIQEVEIALKAGFAPEDIIFTPNCISEQEYEAAIEKKVKINVDNLQTLEYIGVNHPGAPLCLRLNPHLLAGGNKKISVGSIDSKFGISIHQTPLARRLIENLNIEVEGLHVHTGSDILDADIFLNAAELIFAEAERFDNLKYIDFGSGFKVKYKPDDLYTDIEKYGVKFSRRFNEFCDSYGKALELKFEPGKYLVSEAGVFIARVNLVKQTTACNFAGVDAGFNHFIRPMFYDAHHEIENISAPEGEKKLYNIVGYLCETDTFGSDRLLSEVSKNDLLMFKNAGAYCYAMSSNYNSRLRPPEVLIYNGKDYLISRRETLEDLTRNQLDPDIEF